jgi:hypothetical protein
VTGAAARAECQGAGAERDPSSDGHFSGELRASSRWDAAREIRPRQTSGVLVARISCSSQAAMKLCEATGMATRSRSGEGEPERLSLEELKRMFAEALAASEVAAARRALRLLERPS